MDSSPIYSPDWKAAVGSRAIGALFMSLFGAAWLCCWLVQSDKATAGGFGAIATVSLALCLWAGRIVSQYRSALREDARSSQGRRRLRLFNFVNAAQWIAIVLAVNLLMHVGLSAWIVPAIVIVVGLHFFPLGKLFGYAPHYISGAALVVIALACPVLSAAGPNTPATSLGAGLVLLASAVWALQQSMVSEADPRRD